MVGCDCRLTDQHRQVQQKRETTGQLEMWNNIGSKLETTKSHTNPSTFTSGGNQDKEAAAGGNPWRQVVWGGGVWADEKSSSQHGSHSSQLTAQLSFEFWTQVLFRLVTLLIVVGTRIPSS
jgi:hypothetical protein